MILGRPGRWGDYDWKTIFEVLYEFIKIVFKVTCTISYTCILPAIDSNGSALEKQSQTDLFPNTEVLTLSVAVLDDNHLKDISKIKWGNTSRF